MDRYVTTNMILEPLSKQLNNCFDQAKHKIDKERVGQAAKHMEDFIKHLNKEAMSNYVTEEVKAIPNSDGQYLILQWTK